MRRAVQNTTQCLHDTVPTSIAYDPRQQHQRCCLERVGFQIGQFVSWGVVRPNSTVRGVLASYRSCLLGRSGVVLRCSGISFGSCVENENRTISWTFLERSWQHAWSEIYSSIRPKTTTSRRLVRKMGQFTKTLYKVFVFCRFCMLYVRLCKDVCQEF